MAEAVDEYCNGTFTTYNYKASLTTILRVETAISEEKALTNLISIYN